MNRPAALSRRAVLAGMAGMALLPAPTMAETEDLEKAIRAFTNGATLKPGKVKIDLAPIVENGNSVSIGVGVDHPMREGDFVRTLALFNEKNPQPEVAVFHFTPLSGRARVDARIRLATSQNVVAIAQLSDGSFHAEKVEVIVTIAACTEE